MRQFPTINRADQHDNFYRHFVIYSYVSWSNVLFLFIAKWYSVVWVYHCLFTHSLVEVRWVFPVWGSPTTLCLIIYWSMFLLKATLLISHPSCQPKFKSHSKFKKGYAESRMLILCWMECKLLQSLWRAIWQYLKK